MRDALVVVVMLGAVRVSVNTGKILVRHVTVVDGNENLFECDWYMHRSHVPDTPMPRPLWQYVFKFETHEPRHVTCHCYKHEESCYVVHEAFETLR